MEKFKKYALWFFESFIWLGLLLLIIDIVTKNVIVANREYITSQPGGRIVLIPGFLGIGYTVNRNAAFGIGLGSEIANRVVYIVLAVLALAALITVYVKKYKELGKFTRACIMMMCVGALGNLIDRVFFTSEYLGLFPHEQPGVVDWIDFYGIWKYVFNIADSSIVVGTIMLIVWLIVGEVKDSKANKSKVHLKKEDVEKKIEENKTEEVKEASVEEAPVVEEKEEVKEEKPAPKKPAKAKKQ